MEIVTGAHSDTGKVRTRNEDSFVCMSGRPDLVNVDAIFGVADGMGGHAAGDVASRIAVDHITAQMIDPNKDIDPFNEEELSRFLEQIVEEANLEIFRSSHIGDQSGMGTTFTMAAISGSKLFVSHVGDSRAYLYRNRALSQLTLDHSWVEEEVRRGNISREAASNHPYRNVITRALGLEGSVQVDSGLYSLQDRDTVLVCSDGLTTMLNDDQISTVLDTSDLAGVAKELCKQSNDAGGSDNVTVVLAQVYY
jgi:protein phosphatase